MSDDESWRSDLHRDLTAGRTSKRRSRPYGLSAWKRRRSEVRDGACCILCSRFNLSVAGTIADHIVPAANNREDFYEAALQPLCASCHAIKARLEYQWRKGKLPISELDLSISKEGARLRAAAFGVSVSGYPLVQWNDSR